MSIWHRLRDWVMGCPPHQYDSQGNPIRFYGYANSLDGPRATVPVEEIPAYDVDVRRLLRDLTDPDVRAEIGRKADDDARASIERMRRRGSRRRQEEAAARHRHGGGAGR